MSSVTFGLAVGGDGSTVTDGTDPTTGLADGGHRTRFVPALAQVVAVAGFVVATATDAATDAAAAEVARLAAVAAKNAAELALDSMDDNWLGSKTSDPTLDNDGNALAAGARYWNSVAKEERIYDLATTTWYSPPASTVGLMQKAGDTMTGPLVMSDQLLSRAMLKDVGMTFLDKGNSSTTAQAVDYTAGSHQKITATGNFTLTFTNPPPTGNLGITLLEATNFGAYTVTLGTTLTFIKPDGTTTTSLSTYLAANTGRTALQSSGTDFLLVWTRDASTTNYAKLV